MYGILFKKTDIEVLVDVYFCRTFNYMLDLKFNLSRFISSIRLNPPKIFSNSNYLIVLQNMKVKYVG